MKKQTYISANGFEVEKVRRPYGSVPKADRKFKREKKIKRETIRDLNN